MLNVGDAGAPRARADARAMERLTLTGDDARVWLRERGYVTVGTDADFTLVVDELRHNDFVLRRGSFTSVDVIRRPTDDVGRVTCDVFLRGESLVGREAARTEIEPGTIVYHDDADIVSFASSSPVLMIQVETSWDRIQIPHPEGTLSGRVLRGDEESLAVLVAFINTVLDSDLDPEAAGIAGLRLAVEACLSAVAATSVESAGTRADAIASWNLYRRAAGLIIENSSDPTFDIGVLAEELDVSRRRLSRAFTVSNTSPSKYLRRLRALNAFELMAGVGPGGSDAGSDDRR